MFYWNNSCLFYLDQGMSIFLGSYTSFEVLTEDDFYDKLLDINY